LSPQTGTDQKDSQKNVERKLEPAYPSSQPQDDLATIGRKLFNWLDGNERWLVTRLNKHLGEEIVLTPPNGRQARPQTTKPTEHQCPTAKF
jgi:hypothetical protein